jgi:hypothetical protein
MLDGLQIENKTLFDLVQLQETRINRLKERVKELENERDILLSELCEKDAKAASGGGEF